MRSPPASWSPPGPPGSDAGGRRQRRPRRAPRAGLVVLLAAVAVALWAALVTTLALAARDDLEAGRADVEDGRTALGEGRVDDAAASFAAARSDFARAADRLEALPVRLASVPGPGNSVRVVRGLAGSGEQVAAAAATAAEALTDLPGGLAALAPQDGVLPVATLERLREPLARADAALDAASARTEALPDSWLVAPVAEARETFATALEGPAGTVATAHAMARTMPAFLGGDGPRRYLFAASNPAELRGTGGFLGAYAVVELDQGRLAFQDFAPIQDLPTVPVGEIAAPDPSYARRYDRYGGAGSWMNINMTPDFPTAAQAMVDLYDAVRDQRLDGVIVADPQMLAALLRVTGPAELPGGGTLTADTVVGFVSNEAYTAITDPDQRKRLLGAVAASALRRLLDGGLAEDPATAVDTLAAEAARGHLLVYSERDDEQAALVRAGVAGQLPVTDDDLLGVFVNNAAAHKLDYYTDRAVRYDVALEHDGSARAAATVTLANEAPSSGVTPYVIGPNVAGLEAGENLSLVSTYCAASCSLTAFSRSDDDTGAGVERELGVPVFTTPVAVPSGGEVDLAYELDVDRAWDGDATRGVYRLTFADQVTLRPTRLQLSVAVPPGSVVLDASPGLEVDGDVVRFDGVPPARATEFEVIFGEPGDASAWGRLRRALSRPVLRLGVIAPRPVVVPCLQSSAPWGGSRGKRCALHGL